MNACIEWQGFKNKSGYGKVNVRINGKWTTTLAHRIAYEQAKGAIPAGLCVMHTCDNRECVNPEHLAVGTHQENIADRQRKNRQAKGSVFPQAKLTEQDIPIIREMLGRGITPYAIGKQFSVAQSAIVRIKSGKGWNHA